MQSQVEHTVPIQADLTPTDPIQADLTPTDPIQADPTPTDPLTNAFVAVDDNGGQVTDYNPKQANIDRVEIGFGRHNVEWTEELDRAVHGLHQLAVERIIENEGSPQHVQRVRETIIHSVMAEIDRLWGEGAGPNELFVPEAIGPVPPVSSNVLASEQHAKVVLKKTKSLSDIRVNALVRAAWDAMPNLAVDTRINHVEHLLKSFVDKLGKFEEGCLKVPMKISGDERIARVLKQLHVVCATLKIIVAFEAQEKLQRKLDEMAESCPHGVSIAKQIFIDIIKNKVCVRAFCNVESIIDVLQERTSWLELVIMVTPASLPFADPAYQKMVVERFQPFPQTFSALQQIMRKQSQSEHAGSAQAVPTPTDPTPTDPTATGPTATDLTATDLTSTEPTPTGPTATDPISKAQAKEFPQARMVQILRFEESGDAVTPKVDFQALTEIVLDDRCENLPFFVMSMTGCRKTGISSLTNLLISKFGFEEKHWNDGRSWIDGDEDIKGVHWSRRRDPVTKGIWVWSRPIVVNTVGNQQAAVILLDCQGLNCFPRHRDTMDAMITLYYSMLSALQVFNSKGDSNDRNWWHHKTMMSHAKKSGLTRMVNTRIFLNRDWKKD